MSRTILCVVAHPDDESLGPGGALAKWVAAGDTVYVGALTNGMQGRDYDDLDRLKQYRQAVTGVLSCKAFMPLSFPDQQLETVPLTDLIGAIDEWREEVDPDLVITHWPGDLNLDHAVTHRATVTACRDVPALYVFPVVSAPWRESFWPTLFVDISETIGAKEVAVACYAEEVAARPDWRSRDALRAAAGRWRDLCGLSCVEAFQVIREVQ